MIEPTTPPATSSIWEDFIDVFSSPAELFRRRRDGRFGHAILVLVVLTAVIFFGTRGAMEPIFDAEFQRSMASRPGMTPEQLEAARNLGRTLAPLTVLIGLPIAAFLLGAVVWLGARSVGGRISYPQGAAIATFSMFPRLVEAVTNAVQALLMDQGELTSLHRLKLGVSRLLDPDQTSALTLALLGRIDLYTLWVTLLIAVGIKQMTALPGSRVAAAAVVIWLIGAFPTLLQGFGSA